MDAYIFRFNVSDLRKIESRALGFLISSGHCCNELVALMPYIVFEQSLENANEVEGALIIARRYTIDRIIVSKIVEYDELCSKFFHEVPFVGDDLYNELKKEYDLISPKIRAQKWARILRNKASFHFDEKYATDSLRKLDANHPLRMILGRMSGVTLFEFSEEVLGRPIFEEAGSGDIGMGMDAINRFILESIRVIRDFHSRSMISAFTKYGLVSQRESAELRENYCGSPGVDYVALSISTEYISKLPTAKRRGRSKKVRS
jgi:hypothetical protein